MMMPVVAPTLLGESRRAPASVLNDDLGDGSVITRRRVGVIVVRRSGRLNDKDLRGWLIRLKHPGPPEELIEDGKRAEPKGCISRRASECDRWTQDRDGQNQSHKCFHVAASLLPPAFRAPLPTC